ncbi:MULTISPECIES: flagellar basal body rod protein FlgG [Paenibacillus]|uniref:flagellar basal body rod protein FlgG n=1 Tax=Paenibacillus TaxID=44249 RepID=UPI0022B90F2B|nr:flagellar basal body rod protein FlgG [Paenibacillus caseinilyticus]MCZ8520049.1 flagellar basal body rod protein FlgG [Paenibacillus caseinilyticus]
MLRSLYSGVSGMRGFQTKLDVIGNNIANVNTVGFKAGRVMFKDILSQTVAGVSAPTDTAGGVNSKQVGLGVTVGAIDTIHTPGSAMTTNVVTDLRINGDGFFAVSQDGTAENMMLTRDGSFQLDAQRRMVNSNGMFVLGTGGEPITLGEEVTAFTIANNGEIIGTDATGTAASTGQFIAVAKVTNPGGLEKVGGSLYRQTPNSGEAVDLGASIAGDTATGTGSVVSGQLEMSNVDLTGEFTEMIIAQRGFQSNSRIITTSDEILQEVVNLKR